MAQQMFSGAGAAESGYRPDIDGLRAVAVLAVLFYHAGFRGFQGGYSGVDIFFVISGFLIGGHIYAEELAGRFTFAGFYRRRAKRILPALYAVLCAALVMGAFLLSPRELQRTATESISTLFFGSNFYFWKVADYFAVTSDQHVLLMTWSLGVEEQFYLVVPLLLVWLVRRKLPPAPIMALLSLLSFLLACYQAFHAPVAAFYLPPARAWELFGGVLLAVTVARAGRRPGISHVKREVLGALGVVLILAPVVFATTTVPLPALPSVLGSTLLLSLPHAWINRKVLSFGPLRFIGRISYSLYLWHWPLFALTRIVLGAPPSRLQAIAILALSFVLATASYFLVEQPFRGSRTPQVQLLLRYAGTTAALIAVFFAIRSTYGLAERAPALAAAEKLTTAGANPCLVSADVSQPNRATDCWEDSGRPALVLWGDSHADAIAPVARQKAHQAGYDFIEIAKGSCPPLDHEGRQLRDAPGFASHCIAFNDNALRAIGSDSRIRVVMLAACWRDSLADPYRERTGWIVTAENADGAMPTPEVSRQRLQAGLENSVQALRKSGKHVVLVQDAPAFLTEPMWRVRTAALPMRRWIAGVIQPDRATDSGRDAEAEEQWDAIAHDIVFEVAHATDSDLLDLEAALCSSPANCEYRDATNVFYEDNQHLSPAGAAFAMTGWNLPVLSRMPQPPQ